MTSKCWQSTNSPIIYHSQTNGLFLNPPAIYNVAARWLSQSRWYTTRAKTYRMIWCTIMFPHTTAIFSIKQIIFPQPNNKTTATKNNLHRFCFRLSINVIIPCITWDCFYARITRRCAIYAPPHLHLTDLRVSQRANLNEERLKISPTENVYIYIYIYVLQVHTDMGVVRKIPAELRKLPPQSSRFLAA